MAGYFGPCFCADLEIDGEFYGPCAACETETVERLRSEEEKMLTCEVCGCSKYMVLDEKGEVTCIKCVPKYCLHEELSGWYLKDMWSGRLVYGPDSLTDCEETLDSWQGVQTSDGIPF